MKFLLILILPMVISGYEWASPQLVGPGHCGYSRFALDCYNRLWCIFNVYAGPCTLKASYYLDSLWVEPISVYAGRQASGVGGFDATTAKDGKLWVVTSDEYGGGSPPHITIYYDGSVWSDSFVIIGGTGFRLAADSIGKVWAVFGGFEDYRIWCDVCDDTIWTGPYVVCEHPTQAQLTVPRITVDPKGTRWVSAIIIASGQGLLCRSDSAGAWSDSLIMIPSDLGAPVDIVSDNDGNIWIACNNSENILYAAYLDTNLQWGPYYQITQSISRCRIAVANENKVWIVYDKGNNFYYRVWNGIEWSSEDTIVASPASSAFHGDIFYDHVRNRIWVSFKTDTIPGCDVYVTWTNPSSAIAEKKKEPINYNLLTLSNPTKGDVLIKYTIVLRTKISLNLYDNSGRLVKKIFDGEKTAGTYSEKITLKDYPNGVYHLLLKTPDVIIKRKVVFIK